MMNHEMPGSGTWIAIFSQTASTGMRVRSNIPRIKVLYYEGDDVHHDQVYPLNANMDASVLALIVGFGILTAMKRILLISEHKTGKLRHCPLHQHKRSNSNQMGIEIVMIVHRHIRFHREIVMNSMMNEVTDRKILKAVR